LLCAILFAAVWRRKKVKSRSCISPSG
jgi:hypothetical protein